VIWIRGGTLEVARADDIRPRFASDVDERRLPGVAVVGRRREVDLASRVVESDSRERNVVLPTDQPADSSHGGLDGLEPAAVALAPDQPLVVRAHALAVSEEKTTVRVVHEPR